MIRAKGMETGETDEERIGELYTYNYAGWLMESRIPVRVEDGKALYRLTRYRYDKAGNRTEEKRYNDYQTVESAAGTVLTIRYEYDKDDRLVKVADSTGLCWSMAMTVRTGGCPRAGRSATLPARHSVTAMMRQDA